ncbi:hypothetical protein [Megamonas hypermegale]|uniref:hypothetical protein n=1 Tax=Megamonas hypermegale TaxID=158847 RepID=UPI00195E74E8|nr:hypothetical protein [Megamonas hypermegale]
MINLTPVKMFKVEYPLTDRDFKNLYSMYENLTETNLLLLGLIKDFEMNNSGDRKINDTARNNLVKQIYNKNETLKGELLDFINQRYILYKDNKKSPATMQD